MTMESYDILVTLNTQEFYELCQILRYFGEHVNIYCDAFKIKFTPENGSQYNYHKIKNCLNRVQIFTSKLSTCIKVTALLDNIIISTKTMTSLCETTTLCLKNGNPLCLRYNIGLIASITISISDSRAKAVNELKREHDESNFKDEQFEMDNKIQK